MRLGALLAGLSAVAGGAGAGGAGAAEPWVLHTYEVPLKELGLPSGAAQRYRLALRSGPSAVPYDVGGVEHVLAHELPKVLPKWVPRGPSPVPLAADAERVISFFPIAPFLLCAAHDLRKSRHQNRKFPLMSLKGSLHAWRAQGAFDAANTSCLADPKAYTPWITCPTYERALSWLFSQPSWPGREHLHALPHYSADLPRVAWECSEARGIPEAGRSVYARLARSILIATEGRTARWRDDVATGRIVVAPHYIPVTAFLFRGSASELRASKTKLATQVGEGTKKCHRWDNPHTVREHYCATSAEAAAAIARGSQPPADPRPATVRAAVAVALSRLRAPTAAGEPAVGALPAMPDFVADPWAAMRAIAAEYASTLFTIVPPGDAVTSARVHDALAAVSIPVFLVPLEFLPFQPQPAGAGVGEGHGVPWENISVSVDPRAVVAYAAAVKAKLSPLPPNPLDVLRDLYERDRARLHEMQAEIARQRWKVLYHNGSAEVRAGAFDERDRAERLQVQPAEWSSATRQVAAEVVRAAELRTLWRCEAERVCRGPARSTGPAVPAASIGARMRVNLLDALAGRRRDDSDAAAGGA